MPKLVETLQGIDDVADLLARHILELHAGHGFHEHVGEAGTGFAEHTENPVLVVEKLGVALADFVELLRDGVQGTFFGIGNRLVELGAKLGLDGLDHPVDALVDLHHSLIGLPSQLADFIRHHRETASGIAGPGGFDRRIKGQQVGLSGDLPHQVHELGQGLGLGQGRHHVFLLLADIGEAPVDVGLQIFKGALVACCTTVGRRNDLAGLPREGLDDAVQVLHHRIHPLQTLDHAQCSRLGLLGHRIELADEDAVEVRHIVEGTTYFGGHRGARLSRLPGMAERIFGAVAGIPVTGDGQQLMNFETHQNSGKSPQRIHQGLAQADLVEQQVVISRIGEVHDDKCPCRRHAGEQSLPPPGLVPDFHDGSSGLAQNELDRAQQGLGRCRLDDPPRCARRLGFNTLALL